MKTPRLSALDRHVFSLLRPLMFFTSPMYKALTLTLLFRHEFIVATGELNDMVGYCTSQWLTGRRYLYHARATSR